MEAAPKWLPRLRLRFFRRPRRPRCPSHPLCLRQAACRRPQRSSTRRACRRPYSERAMKRLTSRDNPFYKRLKALTASVQQQRKNALLLLEGVHLAQAFLERGRMPDQCVVSDSALELAEVQALVAQIETGRVIVLPDALYQALSTLASGAGLLLLAPLAR